MPDPSPPQRPPRLLLVDEELVASTLAPQLARRMGAELRTATTIDAARELLAEQPVDLLLVAERVADEDALPFLRQARQAAATRYAVLLAEHPGRHPEVDAVVLKPYNLRWMATALRAVLRDERLPRQRRAGRGWHPPRE